MSTTVAAPVGRRRVLAAATLVDSAGDGLYLAGSALFFTRGQGLSIATVGLGLSIAGVIGLVTAPRLGRVADRVGPRDLFLLLMVIQAAAVGSYTLVADLPALVIAATIAAVCRQGAQAARGALIGQLAGSAAAELRSFLHAVVNVGISAGAALAGMVIAWDTHAAYTALMLADAATFAVAALLAAAIPRLPLVARPTDVSTSSALRDHRYLGLTLLNGILALQFVVSGYLLPLWVVYHTHAPRWLASPLLLVNTGLIVLLQVQASRRFTGLVRSARAFRLGGATLGVSFVLFGLAALGGGPATASLWLFAAIIVASVAELLTLAGAFGVSFGLAPSHAVGEYQGLWNVGSGASLAIGPGLLTIVCLRGGTPGWIGLGIAVGLVGWLTSVIVLRAPSDVAPLATVAA